MADNGIKTALDEMCQIKGYSHVECCLYEVEDTKTQVACKAQADEYIQRYILDHSNARCVGVTHFLGLFNGISHYISVVGCKQTSEK